MFLNYTFKTLDSLGYHPKSDSSKQLTVLYLNGNELAELPSEIGQLTNLRVLRLVDNHLTRLPPDIAQLTNPGLLDLSGNPLRQLPPEVVRVTSLRDLYLARSQLTDLPTEIAQLKYLRQLFLGNNALTTLPKEINRLVNLRHLDLSNNRLTELPPEIGQLTKLESLLLNGNQLAGLPQELAQLPAALDLRVTENPLREPLPELAEHGFPSLAAYLRTLAVAEPQYEAKVLLVGEGNVGKSSLVAALQGQPFIENRPTTHGIELDALPVKHPELPKHMTLNIWDFGGQEVYRITHQFFLSRRALYLLVWRPREGQEENAIEAWLKRIRLRVSEEARVILVATHSEERNPELDYPELKRKFGKMLVGNYVVDNRTGTVLSPCEERSRLKLRGCPR
jgi:internalin A